MIETILLIHKISVLMVLILLIVDIVIVIVKGRWKEEDMLGSAVILFFGIVPIVQWLIFVWLVFDIKKELLK